MKESTMTTKGKRREDAFKLRRQAEAIAREEAAPLPENRDTQLPGKIQETIHELRMHQIELTLQNEALRQAQAEIETSRKKYFDLYNQAPVSYCTLSEQGRILKANLTAAALLGVAQGALVKQPVTRFILNEDQDIYYLHCKQPATGAPQVCELRMVKIDGTQFMAHLTTNAAQDADGVPVRHVMISDITERKRMEEELRNTRDYLDNLFNYANAPIIVWNPANRIVRFNAAFERLTDYTADEVIGQEMSVLFPESSRDESIGKIQRTLSNKHWESVEIPILRKNGDVRISLWNAANIYAEDGVTVIATIAQGMDIHARQQMQENLRKSEELNKRIIESSHDCIKILDLDGQLQFMSKGGQELLEIEDIEPYLKQSWTDFWKAPDNKAVLEALSKAKKGHVGQFQGYCPTEKGTEKWWDVIITPIIDRDGKVERLLAVSRDISEHRKMEAQLRQAQKMEAIGTLAGGVAHDFNNILTTIIGYADLMLMTVDTDKSLTEEIEEIKLAGERAAALTRQLLAFSRKQIVQPKILDLNKLLTSLEKMLARLIKEDIEILMIPASALWKVEIDPGQMEQVIMNLVVNAKDAMPSGGKLIIETINMDLDENYFSERGIVEDQSGSYVVLTVSDTGIGMDKEVQKHIFDPFYTTKEKGKGTGLGLSTIYGIVKQNKGFIWAYSEPGQGSTFKIYLPKVNGGVKEEEKERPPVENLEGSETVLIVEDDDSLRKLAQKSLQPYGYIVLAAENGEDALRVSKAHEGAIDLLVTDVVMPRMGGKEVAKRLQPLYPQMKTIYMSGYTDDSIAHRGILAPGLNFIEKPFSPAGLARRVREVLDKQIDDC